jgi:hypothetical protein
MYRRVVPLKWTDVSEVRTASIIRAIISFSSISDSVSIRIPTRVIRLLYRVMVNHNFKVIQSPRCVSAANAICKDIDIFTKDYTSLADIFITLLALRFFVLIHILRVSYCAFDRVSFLFSLYSKLFLFLLCNRYLI